MKTYTTEKRYSYVPGELLALLGEERAQQPFYVRARTGQDAVHYLAEAGFPSQARAYPRLTSAVVSVALLETGLLVEAGTIIVVGTTTEKLVRVTGHRTGEIVGQLARPGRPGLILVKRSA